MPITKKGEKIMGAMKKEYGEEKGEKVFYASKNKGTITGVEGKKKAVAKKMKTYHGRPIEELKKEAGLGKFKSRYN